jgi:4-aminobutyrate aminotransferase-like enzyme
MAKTIGNGLPISAVACSKEIASSLKKITFDTYSANPIAVTAARETLKIIDDEKLQQNSLERGDQFMKGALELQKQYR